jgi:hypothetical protein
VTYVVNESTCTHGYFNEKNGDFITSLTRYFIGAMADSVLESLKASTIFDLDGVVAVVTGGGSVCVSYLCRDRSLI